MAPSAAQKPTMRSRAGLLDQVILGQTEQGIHLHLAVQDRLAPQVFIDGPGARDHADVALVQHVHGDRERRAEHARTGAGFDIDVRLVRRQSLCAAA